MKRLLKLVACGLMGASISPAAVKAVNATEPPSQYRTQYVRSIQGLMGNLMNNGSIVASPSQSHPNYYYDWLRDSSLTMRTVIKLSQDPAISSSVRQILKTQIEKWVEWELHRQSLHTLADLGEPKFMINGEPDNEPWGRPQNDGPGLRDLAAIDLAHEWMNEGRFADIQGKLYKAELPAHTIIKRDLEYISHHWTETSFDLWEEERAMHFFTLTIEKVALLKGAELARQLNDYDGASFYQMTAQDIDQYLSAFIDGKRGIIRYAIHKDAPLPGKQSDLDIAVILAAIQTFDGQFYVPIQEAVQTVNQLAQDFQSRYPINQHKFTTHGAPLGIALGRYPDDKYNGDAIGQPEEGNPWFLATLALAEFTCDLKKANLYPGDMGSQLDETIAKQFNRVLFHLNSNGTMSEQFNRNTGNEQGAHDLTWSYVSYVTAYRACF